MTMHDDVKLDFPAYVAGELTEDIKAKIDRHLDSCAECKTAFLEIGEAARLAAQAPLEFQPPRDLENRVFALVNLEAPDADRAITAEEKKRTDRERWFRPRLILAPAFGAAFIAVVLFTMSLWAQNSDLRERLRDQQGGVDGPSQVVQLTAETATEANATARLVHLGEDNYKIVLTTKNFPEPPRGYQYELWLGGVKGWVSAGSFNTTSPNMTFDLQVGVDPVEFPIVDLTLERANGNPDRNGQEVMRGEVDITQLRT